MSESRCPECGCIYFSSRMSLWCRDGRCDCHSETEREGTDHV